MFVAQLAELPASSGCKEIKVQRRQQQRQNGEFTPIFNLIRGVSGGCLHIMLCFGEFNVQGWMDADNLSWMTPKSLN